MPVLGGIHHWASQSVCLPPPSSTVFCQASELAGSALFVSERGPAHELPSILMLQICQKGCRLQLIASKCARILWHWLAPINGTCKAPAFTDLAKERSKKRRRSSWLKLTTDPDVNDSKNESTHHPTKAEVKDGFLQDKLYNGGCWRKGCHPGNPKHIQADPRVFKALIQLLGKIVEDSRSRPVSALHSPRLTSLRVKCLPPTQKNNKNTMSWEYISEYSRRTAMIHKLQNVTSSLFMPFILPCLDSVQCWRIWRPSICQVAAVWLQWQVSLQKPQRCAAAIPGRPSLTVCPSHDKTWPKHFWHMQTETWNMAFNKH